MSIATANVWQWAWLQMAAYNDSCKISWIWLFCKLYF